MIVDVREGRHNTSDQLGTVYVEKKKTWQYAFRALRDELESVDTLNVSKHKEAADWLVRRQKNIYNGKYIGTGLSMKIGVYTASVSDYENDEEITISIYAKRLRCHGE